MNPDDQTPDEAARKLVRMAQLWTDELHQELHLSPQAKAVAHFSFLIGSQACEICRGAPSPHIAGERIQELWPEWIAKAKQIVPRSVM